MKQDRKSYNGCVGQILTVSKERNELYEKKTQGVSDDELVTMLVKRHDKSIEDAQKIVQDIVHKWGPDILEFWDVEMKHGKAVPSINRYKLQVFLTLLSSLALRASPPSKLAGDLVTAVLFLVPCIGVALETPLLEVVGEAFGKLKGWLGGLIKLKPPALELEATTPALPHVPTTGTKESSTTDLVA